MKTENWAIVASALAGVALVGFFAAPSLLRGPPRDQETLCPKTGPIGQTLILVDKTDPWSEVQAGRLKTLVKQIGEDLPADRLLSIYVFNDIFEPGFPALISLCNPGRTASELIGKALKTLTQPSKGNQSPIIEAIGDVVSRRENRVAEGDRKLVLVSDMLQNSSQFTVFGNGPGVRDPEKLRQVLAKTWQSSGAGSWALGVHQVQGVYEPQRLEQAASLWQQAFQKMNVAVSWDRL